MCSLFKIYIRFLLQVISFRKYTSNQVEIVAYNIQIIETYIISHVTMY